MEQPALLEMRNITKEFPGVKALDGVSLTVRPGTVHALMGENGAGKSTLMKCLFGIYAKNAGTIVLDGKEVDFKSSKEALSLLCRAPATTPATARPSPCSALTLPILPSSSSTRAR